jgi:hypothetical protein
MDTRSVRRGSLVAGGLLLVGGLVAILSVFLPWFDLTTTGGSSGNVTGSSITLGWLMFLAGVVLAGSGTALLLYAGWRSLTWSIVGIVVGAVALVVGILLLADTDRMLLDRAVDDVASFYGQDVDATSAEVDAALDDGSLQADAGSGAWLLVIGSGLGIAGGITGVTVWAMRRRHWVAPA